MAQSPKKITMFNSFLLPLRTFSSKHPRQRFQLGELNSGNPPGPTDSSCPLAPAATTDIAQGISHVLLLIQIVYIEKKTTISNNMGYLDISLTGHAWHRLAHPGDEFASSRVREFGCAVGEISAS